MRPLRQASLHLGCWKHWQLCARALFKRLTHSSLVTLLHTKKENTLICKLRGPLSDNWFILKTLNTVRRKQFLLFPQLGIWTHSRHFSLNQAQASPSAVLAHWWALLLYKSPISSPRHQQTSLSERWLNKKPSIFSSFSGKVKFSFSLQYRSNVIRICFDIILSAKSRLLQPEFTNLAVLPKIGRCHLVP